MRFTPNVMPVFHVSQHELVEKQIKTALPSSLIVVHEAAW